MIKSVLALLLLSCCLLRAEAQTQEDKLSYSFDYGKSKATGTKFINNNLKLRVPVKIGKKSHFTIGGEFGVLSISHSKSLADSSSLKTLGIILGYQTVFDNKNRLSITAEPIIASDFNNLSGNDFRFRSDISYTIHTDRKLSFGFGLAYQYQFSGNQILPVIIPIWRISDNVTLTGAFPVIPRLEVKLDQHWSIGVGLNVNYSSYRLSAFNSQYVQIQNLSFGFTPKYRIDKRFELGAFLGYGNRRIDIYNSDQKVPLRIYSWDIGGGSHVANFDQKFKSAALNLTASYRFQ